jgi:hypothetical protein
MIKIFFFTLVLFSFTSFSQNWNNVVSLNISLNNVTGLDLLTNKTGNHLVVIGNNQLKHCLINTGGSVISTSVVEDNYTDFSYAKILENNNKLYVVYNRNDCIKIKTSSDNGENWFTEINSFEISSNFMNGFDAIFHNNILHVVWSTRDNEDFFETYYRNFYSPNWSSQMPVTDFEWPDKTEGVGGLPSIAVSDVNNVVRVHISFNSGTGTDPAVNIG